MAGSQKKSPATEAKAIREKRDDYDLEAPVLQNVPRTSGFEEIAPLDEGKKDAKGITVEFDGPVAVVSVGGSEVKLDGEGVKAAARIFGNAAADS